MNGFICVMLCKQDGKLSTAKRGKVNFLTENFHGVGPKLVQTIIEPDLLKQIINKKKDLLLLGASEALWITFPLLMPEDPEPILRVAIRKTPSFS